MCASLLFEKKKKRFSVVAFVFGFFPGAQIARKKSQNAVRMLRLCAGFPKNKNKKKHSETGDPISTAEKEKFKIISLSPCDSLVGCSVLNFFFSSKKKKKEKNSRFREIAAEALVEKKLDAAYNSNANRIFFSP